MMDPALARQLQDFGRQALAQWGMADAALRLIAYRENAVFEVKHESQRLALRLHRPGYLGRAALGAELDWLQALARAGVPVPLPVLTPGGHMLVFVGEGIESRHASLLTWVDGVPLGQSQVPLTWTEPDQSHIFHLLGQGMADLHTVSDAYVKPEGFTRHAWDMAGLIGEAPLWGRFWDSALLEKGEALALSRLRDRLAKALPKANGLDCGLIHADLVRENVMVDGASVRFIDFDDAGFGWRHFDIATALLPNLAEPQAPLIARALVSGYQSRRELDGLELLPMFLTLRALTYVGWFASRTEVDPSGTRLRRHIARSLEMARRWETGWTPW